MIAIFLNQRKITSNYKFERYILEILNIVATFTTVIPIKATM
jgi:hypothetical protein